MNETRPVRLLICQRCRNRATKCVCTSSLDATGAGGAVSRAAAKNWKMVPVWSADQIAVAVQEASLREDVKAEELPLPAAVLEQLNAEEERRGAQRRRNLTGDGAMRLA